MDLMSYDKDIKTFKTTEKGLSFLTPIIELTML
jgi:predicted transcriptional regulator